MHPTLQLKAAFPDSHRWDLCWSVSWGCWGRPRPWFHPEGQNPGFQRGPWQSGRPPCPAAPVQQVVSTMRQSAQPESHISTYSSSRPEDFCCVSIQHIKYFNIITYILVFEGSTLYICQMLTAKLRITCVTHSCMHNNDVEKFSAVYFDMCGWMNECLNKWLRGGGRSSKKHQKKHKHGPC